MSMKSMVRMLMTRTNKKLDNNFSILIKYYQHLLFFPLKSKKNLMVMKAKRTDNNRLRITDFKQKKMLKQHKVLLQI